MMVPHLTHFDEVVFVYVVMAVVFLFIAFLPTYIFFRIVFGLFFSLRCKYKLKYDKERVNTLIP